MAEAASRLHAALAGRYEGRQELGVGGMATVDLAHEVTHDRDVAIKSSIPNWAPR